MISSPQDLGHCTTCKKGCCNCDLCVKSKGRKNVCHECAAKEKAAKKT